MQSYYSALAHVPPAAPDEAPRGGWVSWVDWQNNSGTPIAAFSATWIIPPEPSSAGGQLIYLFNGLQDAGKSHILQPVLQCGEVAGCGKWECMGLGKLLGWGRL